MKASKLKTQLPTLLAQTLVVGAILYVALQLFQNTQANLEARNIASGFGFLSVEGGLPINDTLLPYSPADTYGQAFVIGILNTLFVSALSIVLATILGVLVGVARVSTNWLVARLAAVYVEVLRNIPLLLTLFFCYSTLLAFLPAPRNSLNPFGDIFINNRGMFASRPEFQDGMGWVFLAVTGAALASILLIRKSKRMRDETGRGLPAGWLSLGLLAGLPTAAYFLAGQPLAFDVPALKGFNFKGGMVLKPEFSALLIGLVMYTAAFIGENVRSGIQSVDKGQLEAAKALGLKPGMVMRKVILPQTLRVCIPATTNDYTSLVKNSSLAVAIGYPDMVSIGGTIIGQNDQAIEIIGMWMAVYLTINLVLSMGMNWFNAKVQLVER
ncbi:MULTISPECIES: ABC transporter permease subunit [unclassified Pseudodesulfovibrio]|uniref:amino acid ABC transporter permease n=1 Tax=unclassified Pseudodesulfovibrio TaxID=2661612 RepID=UPI000FEB63AE|nr:MULTISPECIES: ABC transporter permease subunit [unclassified Pseudodesulfovibrio]MCJ2165589.1 ABC transporter permease subunit [Pseudodesulfovibrio sp. S3-i]RWU03057.1 ABC transporter permease subunit [Pseudodesulfovibrio sp. S3]